MHDFARPIFRLIRRTASSAVPASRSVNSFPSKPCEWIGTSCRGLDFIKWADADSVVKIISHVYAYAQQYIDPKAPGGKDHIGYIVDKRGTEEFLRWIRKNFSLPPKAEVYTPLYWNGIRYSDLK